MTDNRGLLITNIQRFSLHDGPGIRTTVFLKGCSLHCPWCSNPENLEASITKQDVNFEGKWWRIDDLYQEVMKDKIYYDINGGVTFSGGEALLWMKELEPLLDCLKKEGIHQCVETALFVPTSLTKIALNYIDLFYVDMKILDEFNCKSIIGGDINQYLNNLNILYESKANIIFRIPLISPYTSNKKNIQDIVNLVSSFKNTHVELILGHNLAEKKYLALNKSMYYAPEITNAEVEEIREFFLNAGVKTSVCKL